jgi:uncharacterized radical SAM superfamily Fe-S cluster-containing enzyme
LRIVAAMQLYNFNVTRTMRLVLHRQLIMPEPQVAVPVGMVQVVDHRNQKLSQLSGIQ